MKRTEHSIPPGIPAYAFIKREIKNQVENGELGEGDRLPSELELARMYGVSRNPTRQALRDLELEGYLVRTPGRGSFVAPVQQRQKLLSITGWRTLAVACPELECQYTRSVIRGFIQRAAEDNYHTMAYFLRFSNEAEFEFLADIRNSGIDGVAFWLQHPSERTVDLLQRFHRARFPYVLLDRYVRGLNADFVVSDNIDIGDRLTRALLSRGHRKIGYVTAELDDTSSQDRFTGYKQALESSGAPFQDELVGVFNGDMEATRAVVNRIMANRLRPTAFVCGNDGAATKLLDELNQLGYSVPDEVDLALVDDNALSEVAEIPMVTASQAGFEMGRKSAELLMARVTDPGLPVQQVFLKARVQVHTREPSTL